jgi:tetratricopeptide (TPR) repeat protein
MKVAPLPPPSALPAAKIEAGQETKNEAKSEVKPPKTFPPFDMTKDQQQRERGSGGGAPVDITKKALPPGKSKKISNFSETSKSERDAALYTAKADEQSKSYNQAITNYKIALEKDPRNYLIMNGLSNVLIKAGLFKESVKYSMDALAIQKNYVPSLINLGIANIQLGNATEGEVYLVKAKSLEPSNKTVLFNLGLLYEKLTNFQEALNAFQKLADMKAIEGFVGMARVFEKQGKKPEAEKIYRDILWMDNVDPTTKQFASERLIAMGNR